MESPNGWSEPGAEAGTLARCGLGPFRLLYSNDEQHVKFNVNLPSREHEGER